MHREPSRWEPILHGEPAARARARIHAIASTAHPGGDCGLPVFRHYLGDPAGAASALAQLAATAAAVPMSPYLFGGFTGIAWASAHLMDDGGDDQVGLDLDEIDQTVLDHVSRAPWDGHFDLMRGLVGFAVYALERLPATRAAEGLAQIVDRLDELAERSPNGACWRTRPELLSDEERVAWSDGYYSLGVAHGTPGVLPILAGACATGVAAARAAPLLADAVRWTLAQRHVDRPSQLDRAIAPGRRDGPARAAWCYGDPGVAVALLAAARALGRADWATEAHAMARHVARRPIDDCGIHDAGLCHGAAGLGHMLNRAYQATGDPEIGDRARFWLERALELDAAHDAAATGLLTGSLGVGLALLAATGSREPGWDRLLLLSLPNQSAGIQAQ